MSEHKKRARFKLVLALAGLLMASFLIAFYSAGSGGSGMIATSSSVDSLAVLDITGSAADEVYDPFADSGIVEAGSAQDLASANSDAALSDTTLGAADNANDLLVADNSPASSTPIVSTGIGSLLESRSILIYGIIIVGLLILIMVIVLLKHLIKPGKKKQAARQEFGNVQSQTNPQIASYIKQMKQSGYTPSQIKHTMVSTGWQPNQVDDLFARLGVR